MNVLALFAGIGGIELGLERYGFRTICYVERDPYAAAVLAKQMAQGNLHPALVWDDVTTFDGTRWRGVVDVISGGFPCQDISVAGKGAGIKEGTCSGLWFEFWRIIGEVRPKYVVVENVPMLVKRGLSIVLGQLSEIGYDALWFNLSAAEVGAPHKRERIFIIGMAHHDGRGCRQNRVKGGMDEMGQSETNVALQIEKCGSHVAHAIGERGRGRDGERQDAVHADARGKIIRARENDEWWAAEPDVGRVANGVPSRVDRLRCLGNGVVPQCAYEVGKVILMLENGRH